MHGGAYWRTPAQPGMEGGGFKGGGEWLGDGDRGPKGGPLICR